VARGGLEQHRPVARSGVTIRSGSSPCFVQVDAESQLPDVQHGIKSHPATTVEHFRRVCTSGGTLRIAFQENVLAARCQVPGDRRVA